MSECQIPSYDLLQEIAKQGNIFTSMWMDANIEIKAELNALLLNKDCAHILTFITDNFARIDLGNDLHRIISALRVMSMSLL